MNTEWINFLTSNNATLTETSDILFPEDQQVKENQMTAIANFSILKISGNDADTFLQGQLTCNIKELTDTISFFTAFCNSKGRTISTLLITKQADDFFIILPDSVAEKVTMKLRMYILRAKVQITNVSDEFCLVGLNLASQDIPAAYPSLDFDVAHDTDTIIKLPGTKNRYLVICSLTRAKTLWTEGQQALKMTITSSPTWDYQDISAGLPWLTEQTSEEYIPQMLNIDKLGGVSFNKGCYTGQEIVARTHFLGKAKRELFLAECCTADTFSSEAISVINEQNKPIGKVLSILPNEKKYRLLIVIPTTEANSKNLLINNLNPARISIIDFQ